jgi:hypothetical protein
MRKVTPEDIRISEDGAICSMPLWAFRKDGDSVLASYEWIPELWTDVWPGLAELSRIPHALKPVSRVYVRTCTVCGAEFLCTSNIPSRSCSKRCWRVLRRSYTNQRRKLRGRKKYPREPVEHDWRPCEHCGYEFEPARKDTRFCSGRCRVAHHRAANAG